MSQPANAPTKPLATPSNTAQPTSRNGLQKPRAHRPPRMTNQPVRATHAPSETGPKNAGNGPSPERRADDGGSAERRGSEPVFAAPKHWPHPDAQRAGSRPSLAQPEAYRSRSH